MSGLLPSDSDVDPPEGEPRVLGVDSDDADEVLAALSSSTSRAVLAALHEDPATPSRVADRVDTSLQNAQYHLGKLQDADLVQVAGTRYSEKGREMNVYAPTDGPLVLFAGSEDEGQSMQSALTSLLGGVGALGVASLAVQRLFGGRAGPSGDDLSLSSGGEAAETATTATTTTQATGDGGAGAFNAAEATTTEATRTATETAAGPTQTATETAAEATRTMTTEAEVTRSTTTVAQTVADAGQTDVAYETVRGAEASFGLPPGLLFFAGGVLALAMVAGWRYLR
ncbi:ArsR/SmtB family transcription factor [Halobacteriaceae archaeon GCM10025711]